MPNPPIPPVQLGHALSPELRYFEAPVAIEQRAATEGQPETNTIVGYAFKYNVLSNVIGWGFREEILSGALDGCDLSDVVCRSFHNDNHILGRTTSGTLRLMPDEIGLKFECDLPATQAGNDIAELIRRGDIASCSFEFYLKEDTWGEDPNGIPTRSIRSFRKITDVAPVVRPAYPETELAKRSFEQYRQQNAPVHYRLNLAKRKHAIS
ncbi:MAG: HK97 family phage prohead protease [Marinilabiliaceae bacterium]|nr:HK97 family phage prohead protease [Marinilabiliaceae bacterium]